MCSSVIASDRIDRHHFDQPSRAGPWTASITGCVRNYLPTICERIRFKDPESGKITNNFRFRLFTICALYKSRWQVELFFKWIKQHLRIKQFYEARRRTR